MTQTTEYEHLLTQHLQQLPTTLDDKLKEYVATGNPVQVGSYIVLEKIDEKQAWYSFDRIKDPAGKRVAAQDLLFLRTGIGVEFVYDPTTGEELGNSMAAYCVTDRTQVFPNYARMLGIGALRIEAILDTLAKSQ